MKKPLGIKLIITLSLLGSALLLLSVGAMVYLFDDWDNLFITFLFLAPINAFLLVHLISAYGLWTFKPWALKLSIWIYTLGALTSLFFLVQPVILGKTIEIGELFESLFSILITIAVVRYLSRKNIKEMYT